ncbi:MAG: hypothetical protein U9N35_04945 [Euryarchaeota archaeon]|nr:hypothetical protein [Euryarchaeota archaeon]
MKKYLIPLLIMGFLSTISAETVYDQEWNYITDGEVRNLTLMGDTIIFSSGAYEESSGNYIKNTLYALTLTGTELWKKEFPDLIKKIQIEENIYFSAGRYLYCYSPSFSEQWHYSTNAEIEDFYLTDNQVYLFLADNTIKFLDENGNEKWERRIESGVFVDFNNLSYCPKCEPKKNEAWIYAYAAYYLQPYIYFLDSNNDIVWKYKTVENAEEIYAEDFDKDGEIEILTSHYKFIYVTNKDGLVEWSFRADEYINDICISDKIYVAAGKKLYILDKMGEIEEEEEFDSQVKLVVPEDIDNDGEKEILLGMAKWDRDTQEWTENYLYVGRKKVQKTNGPIRDILAVDSDGDGDKEIVLGTDDLFFLKNNILEIKDGLNKKYENALSLYEKKDLQDAKKELLELKDEYSSYGFDTADINAILEKIEIYENGYKLYDSAEESFDNEDYASAKISYKNARKYFEELGNTEMLDGIDKRVQICEEKMAEKEEETPAPAGGVTKYFKGNFLIAWGLLAASVIVLILIIKRRKK